MKKETKGKAFSLKSGEKICEASSNKDCECKNKLTPKVNNYHKNKSCNKCCICPPGPPGPQGPQGERGVTGATGATGPQGERGLEGPQGIQGERGVTGETGAQGERGVEGPQGILGLQGAQGEVGPQGPQGPGITLRGSVFTVGDLPTTAFEGETYYVQSENTIYIWDSSEWVEIGPIQGPQGPQGIQGIQGLKGDTGQRGAQGAQGVQGPRGNQGPQGIQGPRGNQGPVGAQGAAGPGITLRGSVATIAGLPNNAITGDAYFVQSEEAVYVWSGTAWVSLGVIRGPEGVPGPQGVQGPIGVKGDEGVAGPTGPQGPQGIQGPQGVPGPIGPQGSQGIQGEQGQGIDLRGTVLNPQDLPSTAIEGDAYYIQSNNSIYIWDGTAWIAVGPIQGPQGPQGIQGIQGEQGSIGQEGPEGPQGPQGEIGETGPQGPAISTERAFLSQSNQLQITSLRGSIPLQDSTGFTTPNIYNIGSILYIFTPGYYYINFTLYLPANSTINTVLNLNIDNVDYPGASVNISKSSGNTMNVTIQAIFEVIDIGTFCTITSDSIFSVSSPGRTIAALSLFKIS